LGFISSPTGYKYAYYANVFFTNALGEAIIRLSTYFMNKNAATACKIPYAFVPGSHIIIIRGILDPDHM
jgi:hypothetical protein